MMIWETLRIGDQVIIIIPKENRQAGYNPCPDGTKAKVLDFSEIDYGRVHNFGQKPGIYVNRAWVQLRLASGRKHVEWCGRLKLVDKKESKRREQAWRKAGVPHHHEFIRDLPETPVWEGDKVRVSATSALQVITSEMPDHDSDIFVVTKIEYLWLTRKTNDGSDWPAYNISDRLDGGWHTSTNAGHMKLVSRGNVWKWYHHEKLTFADIREEATFYQMIGQTDEVRNPKNGYFGWTKEEALAAIRTGIAHGLSVGSGFFGSGPSISVIKFRDADVGLRIAKATLQGFAEH